MVFPGVLRGRPGTSTRNHPHEPTTSKPVVPGDVLPDHCNRGRRLGLGGARWRTKNDAVPGRLRNPLGRALGPFFVGGAASHLGGLALCGSGSASGFKVARPRGECNPILSISPHVPQKTLEQDLRMRAPRATRPLRGRPAGPSSRSCVRARESLGSVCAHGSR